MSEFSDINDYIQQESGFTAEMIIGTSYDETLGDNISVTLIATGFESIPKENKIIVGAVETKTTYVPPVVNIEPKPIPVQPITPKPIAPEPTRYSLEEELIEPKKPESNPNEIELNLRIEEEVEEEPYEMELPQNFFDDMEDLNTDIEERVSGRMPEPADEQLVFKVMDDQSIEAQEKKIEKHIQRIKTLKDLNITINTPQGLRDLEKEPAYKRKMKRLEEVPHSSATQASRLSLFDDSTGKPEIKTNNSFLHDNVD
jgi:cell division protein FtsZ